MVEETSKLTNDFIEDDFGDLDELKNKYKFLKKQRDTYKQLLANYERIFLQDGVDIQSLKKENDILMFQSQIRKFEPESEMQNSFEQSPLNINKRERQRAISQKIEELNNEITTFKEFLDDKNISSEIDLGLFSQKGFTLQKNLNKNNSSFDRLFRKESLSKNSFENHMFLQENQSFSSNNEEIKPLEEGEISHDDSAYKMQIFLGEIVGKVQNLEVENQNLNTQLQVKITEKDNLTRFVEDLRGEVEELRKIVELQRKDNHQLKAEKFLIENEIKIEKKNNMCQNICQLI